MPEAAPLEPEDLEPEPAEPVEAAPAPVAAEAVTVPAPAVPAWLMSEEQAPVALWGDLVEAEPLKPQALALWAEGWAE